MKRAALALMALCVLHPALAMENSTNSTMDQNTHEEHLPNQNDGQTSLTRAAARGDVATCKQLIADGADVNESNAHGITPLNSAMAFGYKPVIQLLLEHGANVNTKSNGQTPLFRACHNFNFPVSKLLIEHGANVNTPDSCGFTPLKVTLLSRVQSEKLVRLLLIHGADIFPQDNNGENALMLAAYLPDDNTVCKILVDHQIELEKRMYTLLACMKHASPAHECAKLLYRQRKDLLWPHLNCYKLQTILSAKNKKGGTAYDLSAKLNKRHEIERLEWLKPKDEKKKDAQ